MFERSFAMFVVSVSAGLMGLFLALALMPLGEPLLPASLSSHPPFSPIVPLILSVLSLVAITLYVAWLSTPTTTASDRGEASGEKESR